MGSQFGHDTNLGKHCMTPQPVVHILFGHPDLIGINLVTLLRYSVKSCPNGSNSGIANMVM